MGGNAQNKYVHLVDEAEGLDKIEDLQNHEQEEIYDKAANILEAFFDVEDGEVENLAPQVRSPWVPQAFAGCCALKLSAKAKAACTPARHKLQGASTVLACSSGLTRLLELQMDQLGIVRGFSVARPCCRLTPITAHTHLEHPRRAPQPSSPDRSRAPSALAHPRAPRLILQVPISPPSSCLLQSLL
jgi:hypothetical protein